jgi:hypothetical protein
VFKTRDGVPVKYFTGAGWNRSGQFTDRASWENYVKAFAAAVAKPLDHHREREAVMPRVWLACCRLVAQRRGRRAEQVLRRLARGHRPARGRQARGRAFHPDAAHGDAEPRPQALHYSHVATWVGTLQFAAVTQDQDLMARLVTRFEPFLAPDAPRVPRSDHVDADVFGALPLELYLQTHRYQYRLMGLAFAEGSGTTRRRRPDPPDALVDRRHVHDHRRCNCRRIAPPAT